MDRGNNNRFPLGVIFGVALALIATGGGLTWFAVQKMKSSQSPVTPTASPSPVVVQPPVKTTPPKRVEEVPVKPQSELKTQTVQVYWFDGTQGEVRLHPTPVSIPKTASKNQTLKQAFTLLLEELIDANHTTAIPQGTRLLGLKEDSKGIYVNLSQPFTEGGGSDVMLGRLAQVLYTATSLNSKAKVWISVEGQPLEVLGEGDGLIVDQPMTRQIFAENFTLDEQ